MSDARWQRIVEIYDSLLPLDQTERRAFLARNCKGDTSLIQEVNSLLEADASSGDFLEVPVFELGLNLLMNDKARPDSEWPKIDQLVGVNIAGRYRVEKVLGYGGMGAVYLARDSKLHGKPVVVKVLLEESLQNPWVVQKFQQEKEALARVDHPGVVGILDTGELTDGQPYMVMQYVEGCSLRDAIAAHPDGMDLVRAASIIEQLGAALDAVHQQKIYHRDLKPENVMLQTLGETNEQVKIVDFGIAKIKESIIAPTTISGVFAAGSLLYMSPEQLRAESITSASDVYSFGLIAYELVTGRLAFDAKNLAQLVDMQRDGVRVLPVDLRPGLSPVAQALIIKAIEIDPEDRCSDAAEFGDSLSAALLNEGETLTLDTKELDDLPGKSGTGESPPGLTKPKPAAAETQTSVYRSPAVQPVGQSGSPASKVVSGWSGLGIGLGVLLIVIATVLGGYLLLSKRQLDSETLAGGGSLVANRSLVYSLTVQKMRDGKPYQEPFESSGQEIFETGYKFRLNVSSPEAGYLYVFNDGAAENSPEKILTIIYPTPATNHGSAKLGANQRLQTNWNTFAGKPGTEFFWVIWSEAPVDQMEVARDAAFKNEHGELRDAALSRNVRDFLSSHSEPKPATTKDTVGKRTMVSANGNLLVKLLELEHR